MNNKLIEYFKNKYCYNKNINKFIIVHCPTKNLANKFVNIVNNIPITYWGIDSSSWNFYKHLTGYCLLKQSCCNVEDYCFDKQYNIVLFTEDDYYMLKRQLVK